MSSKPGKSRVLRRLFFLLLFLAFGGWLIYARSVQKDFQPVIEPMSAEHRAFIDKTPHYGRPVGGTYLSLPEWYLVFSSQEYASILKAQPPSSFPYFQSIGQLWFAYAQVYGISRHFGSFNFGDHLMVMVIGSSTTLEYTIKGLYEGSVGRISEWSASGARVTEDDYAAKVAHEYGEFIPIEPWYDFRFGRAFAGLWSECGFFGPHFPRKLERKFFLSIEYGAKTLYAGLIRLATKALYGDADSKIYMSVHRLSPRALSVPGLQKIRALGAASWIITVPRCQAFTDTLPMLAGLGVEFEELGGNSEMLLTLLAPDDWGVKLPGARPLFSMKALASPGRRRVAVQAPATSMGAILRQIKAEGLQLEHIYD